MEILLVEDGLMDARVTIAALKEGDVKHRMTLIRDGQEALLYEMSLCSCAIVADIDVGPVGTPCRDDACRPDQKAKGGD